MLRSFRKFHRSLALIMALPLLLTIVTGVAYSVLSEWIHADNLTGLQAMLLQLHTGRLFKLEKFYPLLNGLGLLGLLVTGITMTRLFRQSSQSTEP
jgi:hypothetical protein